MLDGLSVAEKLMISGLRTSLLTRLGRLRAAGKANVKSDRTDSPGLRWSWLPLAAVCAIALCAAGGMAV